ncbi:lactate dehydrogenase [Pseudovibrio japonicus]|uniref:Lactate dehydrogenase n=1 Tax=Pseudovibrio japonicus TaxID=366534 RepID=A0ABQ3EI11_9HYPH|nr:Ldh family oxidoreductase [Pseudovibrio japonicus]GHB40609.1 lactate dehydrogenase [Pseudovibrio japonicus]
MYSFDDLVRFSSKILQAAGLNEEKASVIARLFVTADAMGHDTHGLKLVAFHMPDIEDGHMLLEGEPDVLQDRGATVVWDGKRLSGVWLAQKALSLAAERAKQYGTCSIAIQRAHHTGCLEAFLPELTEQGLIAMITNSVPASKLMAPFGGLDRALSTNPFAVGIPTGDVPILIDMSCTICAGTKIMRWVDEGKKTPGYWIQDAQGNLSNDPTILFSEPKGTLLPIGGHEYGHKGYNLALMVEALTQGLSGFGGADYSEHITPGSTNGGKADLSVDRLGPVFIQVTDPEAFLGLEAFERQTKHLVDSCKNSRPINENEPVRLPGTKGYLGLKRAKEVGLELYPGIMEDIIPIAERYGVELPDPLPGT